MHITLDDKSYNDSIDIFPDEIYARFYKDSTLPRTAAVSIGEYEDFSSPILMTAAKSFTSTSALPSLLPIPTQDLLPNRSAAVFTSSTHRTSPPALVCWS